MLSLTGFQYCPRCGQAGLRQQDAKAARCDGCGFVYYHNSAAAAAAIIETRGGIILERRSVQPQAGMLDLPGGFVDYSESAEAAVLREVTEELELTIKIKRYLGSYPNRYIYRGVTYFTTDMVYIAAPVGDPDEVEARLRAGGGDGEVAGVVIAAARELDLEQMAFVSMRAAVEDYLRLFAR